MLLLLVVWRERLRAVIRIRSHTVPQRPLTRNLHSYVRRVVSAISKRQSMAPSDLIREIWDMLMTERAGVFSAASLQDPHPRICAQVLSTFRAYSFQHADALIRM